METIKEENLSPGSSSIVLEEGRGCRSKRKQSDPSFCPVCSVTLRPMEVETHLTTEIDRLHKLSCTKHKQNGKNTGASASNVNGSSENGVDKCWETFQKVKANRHSRQKSKARKRRAEEVICPICNKETTDDINVHVEMCLRRTENSGGESDENIDVEGFEEYEWAGQSRVRATSLLQGGVSTLGTSVSMAEEDEDLVVDGDDTQMYGSPQYSERDVILPGDDDKEQSALRRAVLESFGEKPEANVVPEKTPDEEQAKEDPVLEVLKKRIAELESREQNKEVYKCLICMERYRTPVTSVCCWHVHCEQCWLQTLGAKKLCPQCNMITSPADLRRIYM